MGMELPLRKFFTSSCHSGKGDAVEDLKISVRFGEIAFLIVLSMIAKLCVDYFVFSVSHIFGVYGVEAKGYFFSTEYWVAWISYLLVLSSYLLYMARQGDIFDCSLSFLFFSIFIPVGTLYWVEQGDFLYLMFCSVFWFLLFFVLYISVLRRHSVLSFFENKKIELVVGVLYFLVLALLGGGLLRNFDISAGLGFDSVYERRRSFAGWLEDGGIWVYLYAWSVYVFAVYLIFVSSAKFLKFVGALYVVALYAVAGDKVYLFLLVLICFLIFSSKKGRSTMILCAFIFLTLLGVCSFQLFGNVWISAIVHRFLILPADVSFNYIDYFNDGLLLYGYSFLSSFVGYNYSELPAKLIGSFYYTDGDNANVNFLADAYVNLGWFSIAPLLLFFVVLRMTFRDTKYLVLLIPVFVQAINSPLPTLLLTGGGGLMIVGCYALSRSGVHVVENPKRAIGAA